MESQVYYDYIFLRVLHLLVFSLLSTVRELVDNIVETRLAGIGWNLDTYEYVRTPGKIPSYGTVGAPCVELNALERKSQLNFG